MGKSPEMREIGRRWISDRVKEGLKRVAACGPCHLHLINARAHERVRTLGLPSWRGPNERIIRIR